MAVSCDVDMKEGGKIQDCMSSDAKKFFDVKGNDEKGELKLKEDGSVTIAYEVDGDTCTFTVKQTPKLFSDSDWKGMLDDLFG